MSITNRRSRQRTIAGIAAAALLLAFAALAAAPRLLSGRWFGRLVEQALPATCGELTIGGGDWSWSALWALWRGHPAELALENVRVVDPEGTEVLRAARVSGRLTLRRLPAQPTAGNRGKALELDIDQLHLSKGAWRFARMSATPAVGFLAAFRSASGTRGDPHRCAPPPSPPTPSPPRSSSPAQPGAAATRFSIDLRRVRLDALDVTFDLPDWGLTLAGVRAGGSLHYAQTAGTPFVFTFDVRDAESRTGGRLRVLGKANRLELPFSRARLDHVGTSRDAPDVLALEASQVATGRSSLAVSGRFTGIYRSSPGQPPPGLSLEAHVARAADALQAIAEHWAPGAVRIAGEQAEVRAHFDGPFARLQLEVNGRGLDLRRGAVAAEALALSVFASPAERQVQLKELSFRSPGGGTAEITGSLDRQRAEARVEFRALSLDGLLDGIVPPPLRGTIDGKLEIDADARRRRADVRASRLAWAPTPSAPPVSKQKRRGPQSALPATALSRIEISQARVSNGTLILPRVQIVAAGGTWTARAQLRLWDEAGGGWLRAPTFDVSVAARRVALARLVGETFVDGVLGFDARAHGTWDDVSVRLEFPPPANIRILETAFRLPRQVDFAFARGELRVPPFTLDGGGGAQLTVGGRVRVGGRLELATSVRRFPLTKLPGLAETGLAIAGDVSGDLQVKRETADPPKIEGQLTLAGASWDGHHLGTGALRVKPAAGGGILAEGRLFGSVGFNGTLAPAAGGGVRGDARITLDGFALDPLLPRLPGGRVLQGRMSGAFDVRVAPGRGASLDGTVGELRLALELDAGAARAGVGRGRRLEVRAMDDVRVSGKVGGARLDMTPTRFAGNVGSFVVSTVRPPAGAPVGTPDLFSVRGKLALAPFAPLLCETVRRAPAVPSTRGTRRDTPPQPVRAEFERRLCELSGTLDVDLSFDVSGRRRAVLTVRGDDVSLGPGVDLGVGHSRGGPAVLRFDLDRKVTLGAVDIPLRSRFVDLALPGLRVGEARMTARLLGDARQDLTLRGDVEIVNARVNPGAAGKGGAGGTLSPRAPSGPPELARTRLDVSVHSTGGAILVEVPYVPDPRVDVDVQIGGTLAQPRTQVALRGANRFSAFALWVQRLFGKLGS